MGFFDILLLVAIAAFALFGLWVGFIQALGSLFGTVLGVYLASRYYEVMAEWLMNYVGWSGNTARIVMFIVAFIIINRLVGIIFWFIGKVLNVVAKLPFIAAFNRLAGVVFGAVEGIITVGFLVYLIVKYPFSDTIITKVAESIVAPYALGAIDMLLPFAPDAMRALETTIDFVERIVS